MDARLLIKLKKISYNLQIR